MEKTHRDELGDGAATLVVYNEQALASLEQGLRHVFLRRGRSAKEAQTLFDRLSANLRILDYLHGMARRALGGDAAAAAAFRSAVESLAARYPNLRGSTGVLLQRAGVPQPEKGALAPPARGARPGAAPQRRAMALPGRQPLPEGRGPRCATIRFAGMAAIYMALWDTYILEPDVVSTPATVGLPEALDTVVGLSLGHGHLEVLAGSLAGGGLDGLAGALEREMVLGNPVYRPGRGYMPAPGGPGGEPFPGPDDSPFPGLTPEPDGGPVPGSLVPPAPEECELIREGCEAWLIEELNQGLPPIPNPPATQAWADNITSIELRGRCAGDIIIVRGHDFGYPQPPSVDLIMRVNGRCAVVDVAPGRWHDSFIEVVLPAGVTPGAVGFYDRDRAEGERDRYNNDVETHNRAVRALAGASKCAGLPLDLPTFPLRGPSVPCPPVTEHNFIEVGLPIVRSFSVSTDTSSGAVVVAAPDDRLFLRWEVENVERIALQHSWRSGDASGSETISSDAQGSSFDLGLADHLTFGTSTYRMTAYNPCGQAQRSVRVIRSQRPRLSIDHIEVTQSIQTVDGDLPLVANKPTAVRVYGSQGLNGFGDLDRVPNVRGRLRIGSAGLWSAWVDPVNGVAAAPPDPPAPDPDASIDLPETPDPAQTNDTLNFVVPATLCLGAKDIEVELRVENFGAAAGSGDPGFDERVSMTFEDAVTFVPRRPLKLRYIPVTIELDNNVNIQVLAGISNPPTDQQCEDFLRETFKYLPTTPSSIERLAGFSATLGAGRLVIDTPLGPWEITSGWSESLGYDISANAFTYAMGILRACDLLSFTGVICTEDSDAYWAILAPVSGVWGRAQDREFIAPMVTESAAHELAHCLRQEHLTGAACPGGGDAWADPFNPTTSPDHWDNGGQIVAGEAVPFDVIQNRAVAGGDDGVWDLMTYCDTVRWTHPQRWQMIFDVVRE